MENKLTVSVIGGGAGGRLNMNGVKNSPILELKAVTDLRPEVCKQLEQDYPGIKAYTDHQQMFAECPTDVVCVSTYPPSHEPITLDALKLPLKGILVEKPLGHTAASGRAILQAIKAKGIPMAVPHGMLVKKVPCEVMKRVQNGNIGELKLIEIQNDKWDIINAGIHWLNWTVNLLKLEPFKYVMAAIDATTRTYRDGMQVETLAVTYAETQSGIRVVMNTGDFVTVNTTGHGTLFRIVGTLGVIEFYGWENSYYICNKEFPDGKTIVPEEYPVTGHRAHLENMVKMIGREISYAIPESSLTALEICEAAYISGKNRRMVKFPFQDFQVPAAVDWDPGKPYSGKGGGRDGRKL